MSLSQFVANTEGLWIYWAVIALMMCGLYAVISRDHLVKKVMGLNIFQAAAILFYITIGKVDGGTAPILIEGAPPGQLYSNPLPHVLMLTAIVVGIATTALALALTVRIQEQYGTLEEDELLKLRLAEDREDALADPHPFDLPGEPQDVASVALPSQQADASHPGTVDTTAEEPSVAAGGSS